MMNKLTKKARKKTFIKIGVIIFLILFFSVILEPDYFAPQFCNYAPTWINNHQFIFVRSFHHGFLDKYYPNLDKIYLYDTRIMRYHLLKEFKLDLLDEISDNYSHFVYKGYDEYYITVDTTYNIKRNLIRKLPKLAENQYSQADYYGSNYYMVYKTKAVDNSIQIGFDVYNRESGKMNQIKIPEIEMKNENPELEPYIKDELKQNKELGKKESNVYENYIHPNVHISLDGIATIFIANSLKDKTVIYIYNCNDDRILHTVEVDNTINVGQYIPEEGKILTFGDSKLLLIDIKTSTITSTSIEDTYGMHGYQYKNGSILIYRAGITKNRTTCGSWELWIPRSFEIRKLKDPSRMIKLNLSKEKLGYIVYFDMDDKGENIIFADSDPGVIYLCNVRKKLIKQLTSHGFREPLYKIWKYIPDKVKELIDSY